MARNGSQHNETDQPLEDDLVGTPREVSPTVVTAVSRYRYLGHIPSNRSAYVIIDNLKLQPWSMTDDQVDKLLQLRPDLRHRWEVIG